MLKSLFTLSLLTAFLASTLGIQVYKHYCGDYLAEISVYVQSNPCADEGGEDACSKGKTKSCCDDETEYYQLKIDLIKASQKDQLSKFIPSESLLLSDYLYAKEQSKELLVQNVRPPPENKIPLYKELQRLLYYG